MSRAKTLIGSVLTSAFRFSGSNCKVAQSIPLTNFLRNGSKASESKVVESWSKAAGSICSAIEKNLSFERNSRLCSSPTCVNCWLTVAVPCSKLCSKALMVGFFQ